MRRAATPHNNRYNRVFEELIALGIDAQPAVYADDYAGEVRDQLLACDGVLVWVDPIHEGRTRQLLDRGGWENDPLYGRHPSPTKQAGITLEYSPRKRWRSTSQSATAMPGYVGQEGCG